MATPSAAASSAATGNVASTYQPYLVTRMALVNAPTPKKAPCPMEI